MLGLVRPTKAALDAQHGVKKGLFAQLHLLYTDLRHLAQQALHWPVGSRLGLPAGEEMTVKNTRPGAGQVSARGPDRYFGWSFAAICWPRWWHSLGSLPSNVSPLCRVHPSALCAECWGPKEMATLMPLEQEGSQYLQWSADGFHSAGYALVTVKCFPELPMYSEHSPKLSSLGEIMKDWSIKKKKKKKNKCICHSWKYTRGWKELYQCFPEWES